jgi:hypothetical protein
VVAKYLRDQRRVSPRKLNNPVIRGLQNNPGLV